MPIGKTQQEFLESVRRFGRYYPGCGWVWKNTSASVRLAESLVKRGMLKKVERALNPHYPHTAVVTEYRPV